VTTEFFLGLQEPTPPPTAVPQPQSRAPEPAKPAPLPAAPTEPEAINEAEFYDDPLIKAAVEKLKARVIK
jgi:hypothetical protein